MHQQSKLNSWIDCTSSAVAFAQALALFSLLDSDNVSNILTEETILASKKNQF